MSVNSLVGLAISSGPRDLILPGKPDLHSLAPQWIRYLPPFSFQNMETGQNSELDLVLESCRGLGIKTLVLIGSETINQISPGPNSAEWGDEDSGFIGRAAKLAAKIAAFYRRKIDAIEVLSQPNALGITPENYAALLATCYRKIKAVSRIPVISGGICCGKDFPYLRAVIQNAQDSFDGVGWHAYGLSVDAYPSNAWGDGDLRDSITRAYAIAGKPLWLTQVGAALEYDWPAGITPEDAAAEYLKRAFALMRELGPDIVAHAFWYTWKDLAGGWGLVDKSGIRRPCWYAFQEQTHAGPLAVSDVSIGPASLNAGQLLTVKITVKNNSSETLETQGPDPAFIYEEGDSFSSLNFPEIPGAVRIGLESDAEGAVGHPYRWGLGAPLAPGDIVTITCQVRLRSARSGYYWAGLVREQVGWILDGQGSQMVRVEPGPEPPKITRVEFSSATLGTGELLTVAITVQNNSGTRLLTHGPEPGFIYEEGESFSDRGFPSSSGAFRVGLDFEGRAGMDHPYRWGLGAPLEAGETRTITGRIRLSTVQSRNYWAGLVQEESAWVQDGKGVQLISVQAGPSQPPALTAVSFAPTTLSSGELLNISFTVRNNTSVPVPTQGPEPGTVYEEEDSFYTHGFPGIPGAFRVAVEANGGTGINYPYRWGLGTQLAPGETRVISGAIRLRRPQSQVYWAGLVREMIAWLQDYEGPQTVQVVSGPAKPRVVHIHDQEATTWNGQSDYWMYVNQDVVDRMVDRGIMALTGCATVIDAWKSLLPTYRPGEGIAIKVNFANGGDGRLDASIEPLNAIIAGLKQMGVYEGDIWVYEAVQRIPDRFVQACPYRDVKFFDKGRQVRATFTSDDPSAWVAFVPPPGGAPPAPTRVTDILVNAAYVINLPIMKGHRSGAGVTLGFKNHLGSTNNPSTFHPHIFPGDGAFRVDYNPLVDLYRNPNIGKKTILTIADGLFSGDEWDASPMALATFGRQTPNSLFFATDPVALDCVLCDLLEAEWEIPAQAANYLQLASRAALGVFERGAPLSNGYSRIDYKRIESHTAG